MNNLTDVDTCQRDKDFSRNLWCVLGLPFDAVDMKCAAAEVIKAAAEKRRLFVSTPNLNFLCAAQTDDSFRNSVINSDLSIADGLPIVLIAKLLNIPIPERVAGSDLIESLFRRETDSPLKIFFFGGEKEAGKKATQNVNQGHAGLYSVGYYAPGFGTVDEMSTDEIINRINQHDIDFLIVSLGAKKGQAWIEKNRQRLRVPVVSHLGAVINFFAGTVARAPNWIQFCGVEWLWRIYQEPALWRRYYSDGIAFLKLFLFDVLPYWFWQKCCRKNHGMGLRIDVELIHQPQRESWRMRLSGVCRYQTLADLKRQFINFAGDNKDVVVDLQEVAVIDGAFIGQCMLLNKYLALSGHSINLINANKTVRRILKWNKASYLLKCT